MKATEINEAFAEELEQLSDRLHAGEIINISKKRRTVKVPSLVSREPREIQDGMLWNGERVEVSWERV